MSSPLERYFPQRNAATSREAVEVFNALLGSIREHSPAAQGEGPDVALNAWVNDVFTGRPSLGNNISAERYMLMINHVSQKDPGRDDEERYSPRLAVTMVDAIATLDDFLMHPAAAKVLGHWHVFFPGLSMAKNLIDEQFLMYDITVNKSYATKREDVQHLLVVTRPGGLAPKMDGWKEESAVTLPMGLVAHFLERSQDAVVKGRVIYAKTVSGFATFITDLVRSEGFDAVGVPNWIVPTIRFRRTTPTGTEERTLVLGEPVEFDPSADSAGLDFEKPRG